MNRNQSIALAILAINLFVVLLFPPHDYISLQRGNIPTFDGFYFALAHPTNRIVNRDFLALEVLVLAINAAIVWLLLRSPGLGARSHQPSRAQKTVLGLVALNLVLVLLFPPFENYQALTKAVLPTFDGFYFLFGDNSKRLIVTTILYIEIVLVLANGALAWLFFPRH
jgi:hypothetical protein